MCMCGSAWSLSWTIRAYERIDVLFCSIILMTFSGSERYVTSPKNRPLDVAWLSFVVLMLSPLTINTRSHDAIKAPEPPPHGGDNPPWDGGKDVRGALVAKQADSGHGRRHALVGRGARALRTRGLIGGSGGARPPRLNCGLRGEVIHRQERAAPLICPAPCKHGLTREALRDIV